MVVRGNNEEGKKFKLEFSQKNNIEICKKYMKVE